MINKRLLVKNLLAHNDESSFYDKKRRIDLGSKEGKAKFLQHICALSNSNPANNSYIVVGVEDETNEIRGVDFFDDSKIQNLVNAYLSNPPLISYENIMFPHLRTTRSWVWSPFAPQERSLLCVRTYGSIGVDPSFFEMVVFLCPKILI